LNSPAAECVATNNDVIRPIFTNDKAYTAMFYHFMDIYPSNWSG